MENWSEGCLKAWTSCLLQILPQKILDTVWFPHDRGTRFLINLPQKTVSRTAISRVIPWRRGYSSFLMASTDLGYGQDDLFSSDMAVCGHPLQESELILGLQRSLSRRPAAAVVMQTELGIRFTTKY